MQGGDRGKFVIASLLSLLIFVLTPLIAGAQVDLNNDRKPDHFQATIGADRRTTATVELSNGRRFRFALHLPSIGAIIPFDADSDGDLDLVIIDASSALTQTLWNENQLGFRLGTVQRLSLTGERSRISEGSGVDAISLTSPPLPSQYCPSSPIAPTAVIRTARVCQPLRSGADCSPLRFLCSCLTRRGPPCLVPVF